MSRLFKKLLSFLKSLFYREDNSTDEKTTDNVVKEVESVKSPTEPTISEPENNRGAEPKTTDPTGVVQTFLWKPLGDHTNLPVVVVAADKIRSDDLGMEVYGKGGRVLNIDIRNTGRANGLTGYKYARIHFRLNRSGKELQKNAPLRVKFFLGSGKNKKYVLVRGKEDIVVKNPESRVDLK